MDADRKRDDDVHELLEATLNLDEGGLRGLLEHMPRPGLEEVRLQCVREMSISVLCVLAEWVAEEGDTHGTSVLESAVGGLMAGDDVARKLGPQVATCERCGMRVFTGPECAQAPACPTCGGPTVRPA